MKKHNFQILSKKQQANILGGRQLCAGQVGSLGGATVVEDGGKYYLTLWGVDDSEAEITAREAGNVCRTILNSSANNDY